MTRITIGPFIVPADLRESLLRECEETGAPQGELVRRALLRYLERKPRVRERQKPRTKATA